MRSPSPFNARAKLPALLQTETSECGLACVAMIATYFGHPLDLMSLRAKLATSLKGMNLTQLMTAAQAIGLAGRPLRLELEEIGALRCPCILHWDMNHFVVLKSVQGQHLTLHDPAIGVRRLPLAQAGRHFTGVALELLPTPDFETSDPPPRVRLRDLIGRVRGWRAKLAQILAVSLAVECFALVGPLYVQWTVDHALVSGDRDLVTLLALGFGMACVMQATLAAARSWIISNFNTQLGLQWSASVFSHLLRLPPSYFEKRHLGDVVSRFESITTIQRTLTTSFFEVLVDGFMAIVTLVTMVLYSGPLTLVTVFAATAYALLRVVWYGPLRDANETQIVLAAKQQSTFLETIRGIQAIKLFGHEGPRLGIWQNRSTDTAHRALTTQRMMIAYRLTNGLLLGIENIVVVWWGAQLILGGVFSAGMLFAFVVYKNLFSSRITALVDKGLELRMLQLHGQRLADIVLTQREAPGAPDRALTGGPFDIRVRNLGFRYGSLDPWVLQGLDLDIPAGASVAITGPSGCGKSTLAKLLLGLLQPTEGRILAGDLDLGHGKAGHLRSVAGAVMQDDQLFAGSIMDNICFFETAPDAARMEHAAAMAAIHEDIVRMPMGYQSLVGDMGTALSGGQRQRILLARALYRQPRVLVLDEATSHLDPPLEGAINDAIRRLQITRIVIAHRPQTIAACDHVIDLRQINRLAHHAL